MKTSTSPGALSRLADGRACLPLHEPRAGIHVRDLRALRRGISGEFAASRSLLSAGLALVVTFMGLLAPAVGRAIRRWSIRRVMSIGLVVLALMFLLASIAASAWQFVAIFGLLGGVAAACLVIVPPTTLINNWFVEQRGKATGLVMIPFLVMAMPPVAAAAITSLRMAADVHRDGDGGPAARAAHAADRRPAGRRRTVGAGDEPHGTGTSQRHRGPTDRTPHIRRASPLSGQPATAEGSSPAPA